MKTYRRELFETTIKGDKRIKKRDMKTYRRELFETYNTCQTDK